MPSALPSFKLLIDAGEASAEQVFNRMELAVTDGWHRSRKRELACKALLGHDQKLLEDGGPFAVFVCDNRRDREAVRLMLTFCSRSRGVLSVSHLCRQPSQIGQAVSPVLEDFCRNVLKPAGITHALCFSGPACAWVFSSKPLVLPVTEHPG